jgi:hypothetical protein
MVEPRPPGRTTSPWKGRLISLLTAMACLSCGTLLLLLPWDTGWDQNYFSGSNRTWFAVWTNPYFRGAISGIGALNVYVALLELAGMARGLRG